MMSNFSQYIEEDALGQHHIRVGKTVYVVDSKRALGSNGWSTQILKLNRLQPNGFITPVSQVECFEKGWLIRTLIKELDALEDRNYKEKRKANAHYYSHLCKTGQNKKRNNRA